MLTYMNMHKLQTNNKKYTQLDENNIGHMQPFEKIRKHAQ